MTRRTKAEWQALIVAQQESGLSAAAFCRERGIRVNYYCRVRNQFRLSDVEKTVPRFVPVSVTRLRSADKIIIRCEGEATVEIPFGIEPRWVAQLLHALRD